MPILSMLFGLKKSRIFVVESIHRPSASVVCS